MELLLIVIAVGVFGYFIGRSRRPKVSPPSEQVIDVESKETEVKI